MKLDAHPYTWARKKELSQIKKKGKKGTQKSYGNREGYIGLSIL